MQEIFRYLAQIVEDDPIVPAVIVLLSVICIWINMREQKDSDLLKPYACRLGHGPISVDVSSIRCNCGKRCLSFWRHVKTVSKGLEKQEEHRKEEIGLFCAVCGHERLNPTDLSRGRKPRELEVFMRQIETGGGEHAP